MPVFLKAKPDMLVVTMGKLSSSEFGDALARLKSVPGRNWNPQEKQNEFPKDADTALRLMQMLEPVADAETQALVRNHASQVAEQLVTKLPEDAELDLPYADLLRPYQRAAVKWLEDHPRSILADEMGLGKTVQAIATVTNFHGGTIPATLVVCPNAVRGTWESEFKQWADTPVQVLDGKTPAKRVKQLEADSSVFIVNWEKLRLMPELARVNWEAVIADEAHRAKNRDAQQTQALWKLTAPVQLALTGTPIMNHPGELWSLLRWLRPEQFAEHVKGGGYWPFHYSYVDEYQAAYGTVVTGVRNPDQLRFVLSDKLVRRTKKVVLKDLPDKMPTPGDLGRVHPGRAQAVSGDREGADPGHGWLRRSQRRHRRRHAGGHAAGEAGRPGAERRRTHGEAAPDHSGREGAPRRRANP
jgi:SNF2 family DNA or RNA helicase